MFGDGVARDVGVGALLAGAWIVVVLDSPVLSGVILFAGGLVLLVLGEQGKLEPRRSARWLGSLNVLVGAALAGGLLLIVLVTAGTVLVVAAALARHRERPDRTDRGGLAPPAAA